MPLYRQHAEGSAVSVSELAEEVGSLDSYSYAEFLNSLGFRYWVEGLEIGIVCEQLDEYGLELLKALVTHLKREVALIVLEIDDHE
jgi:hypothetical protein